MFFIKNKYFFILFFTLVILCFIFFVKYQNYKIKIINNAENISMLCSTEDRNNCLKNEILKYAKNNSKDTGFMLEIFEKKFLNISSEEEVDFLINFVHDIGMYFVWNKISVYDAFQYCGISFMQGCVHGVVMQYADDFNVKEKNDLVELCEKNSLTSVIYLNCLHGVGHVLASKNEPNIASVVHFCDSFENSREKIACGSGFLMEYSKGGEGKGHHSENKIGTNSLNCLILNGLYLNICNVYQKHYIGKN